MNLGALQAGEMLWFQEYETFSTPLSSCKLPLFSAVVLPVREENIGKRCVGTLSALMALEPNCMENKPELYPLSWTQMTFQSWPREPAFVKPRLFLCLNNRK